ncbi:MAG: class I SAM-dependent methyltransferase [Candidatus Omnitrophica bacterium]|nr:class I SAM-dependent methyltransferase [Candidatus Omnitrophota bacterium]
MSDVSKKTIQDFWTRNVPGWDVFSKKYSPEDKRFYLEADAHRYRYDDYIPALIDSFAAAGLSVLEIGCGLGTDSRTIAAKGCSVTSLDLSPSNVSFTMKGMKLFGLKGRGVCADAEKLPFKDASFDLVYSFGVLHHTPNTRAAIREIQRVLRPKGRCVVMLYHKGYAYYLLLLRYGWQMLLRRLSSEKLMSRYDSTPLSKLYSKKEIRSLFDGFDRLDFQMTTYGGAQLHPVFKFAYRILRKSRFLMQRFGSFIIIRGSK